MGQGEQREDAITDRPAGGEKGKVPEEKGFKRTYRKNVEKEGNKNKESTIYAARKKGHKNQLVT